ncbi:MAG: phytanoyl-CoA dioxygenase family protein [Luteolibacter sp.]|uniref:phytanoyl-CoA dioxygenase family protein n=1 Tax=Luteolibacter sp. TaxID=1962973 RepID=UPI003266EA68
MNLANHGFAIRQTSVSEDILNQLRRTLFHEDCAGERSLLDEPLVRETALILKQELSAVGNLYAAAIAIQAIAFNKTASKNWKVAWHQDLMFPFANRVTSQGFDLPSIKQGIHYAMPPESVLEQLLAVRLHLDDWDATNGPLRISPGTHLAGILKTAEISNIVTNHGEITALARKGDALLMRPLTLHTSSQATEPKHRRVLHFVYYSGNTISETWHRAI